MRVALAPDGTIWAQGNDREVTVFRQFSKSGKTLRAVVPPSEIANRNSLVNSINVFEAVGDQIVWYYGTSRQHIAISTADGAVVKTNDLPLPNTESFSGGAIGPKGELFASAANGETWT